MRAHLVILVGYLWSLASAQSFGPPLCLSLQGSAACPAFQDQYISPQSLESHYTFFSNVTDVSSFDSGLLDYIYGEYAVIKFGNEFGCSGFNSATDYARWTLTWLCTVFSQNTESMICNQANNGNPKALCTQTCTEFAYSQASIVSNNAICGPDRSGGSRQFWLNQDAATCTNWTTSATQNPESDSCVLGSQNEGNCGFGGDTVGLCNYCNPSTNANVDPCCYSSSTNLGTCRYSQSLSSLPAPSTTPVISSSAVNMQYSALAAAEASIIASGFSAITNAVEQYLSTAGGSVVSGYFGTTTLSNPTLILAPIGSSSAFGTSFASSTPAPTSQGASNQGQAAPSGTTSGPANATPAAATQSMTDTTATSSGGGGLSGGQIVGIALGCVALLATTLVLLACVCTRRRRRDRAYLSKTSSDSLNSGKERYYTNLNVENPPMVQSHASERLMGPPPPPAALPPTPRFNAPATIPEAQLYDPSPAQPIIPPMAFTQAQPQPMMPENRHLVYSAVDPAYYRDTGRSSPRLLGRRHTQRPDIGKRRRSLDDTRRKQAARLSGHQFAFAHSRPLSQVSYHEPVPYDPMIPHYVSQPNASIGYLRPTSPASTTYASYSPYGAGHSFSMPYNMSNAQGLMQGPPTLSSTLQTTQVPPRRASIVEATHFPEHHPPSFQYPTSSPLTHQQSSIPTFGNQLTYERDMELPYAPIQGFQGMQLNSPNLQHSPSQHLVTAPSSPPASVTGRSHVSMTRRDQAPTLDPSLSQYQPTYATVPPSATPIMTHDFAHQNAGHAGHVQPVSQQVQDMTQRSDMPATSYQYSGALINETVPTHQNHQPANLAEQFPGFTASYASYSHHPVATAPGHQQPFVNTLQSPQSSLAPSKTKQFEPPFNGPAPQSSSQMASSGAEALEKPSQSSGEDELQAALEKLVAEESARNASKSSDHKPEHAKSSSRKRSRRAEKKALVIPKRASPPLENDAAPFSEGLKQDKTPVITPTVAPEIARQTGDSLPAPVHTQNVGQIAIPETSMSAQGRSPDGNGNGQIPQQLVTTLSGHTYTGQNYPNHMVPRVPVEPYIMPQSVRDPVIVQPMPPTGLQNAYPAIAPAASAREDEVLLPTSNSSKAGSEPSGRSLGGLIAKARAKATGKSKDKTSDNDKTKERSKAEKVPLLETNSSSNGPEYAKAGTLPREDGGERRSSIKAHLPTEIEPEKEKNVAQEGSVNKAGSSSVIQPASDSRPATSRPGSRPTTRPNSRPGSFTGSTGKAKSLKSGATSVITAFQDRFSDNPILVQSAVTVVHPYTGTLVDELSLVPGAEVVVKKMYDDGWAIGTIADPKNPQITRDGAFPLVCVTVKTAFSDGQHSSGSEKQGSSS